jgi:hypothetical protein
MRIIMGFLFPECGMKRRKMGSPLADRAWSSKADGAPIMKSGAP